MPGRKDCVPRGAEAFDAFFKNIVQYAAQKSAAKEWEHIPKKALDDLSAAYGAWYTAYAPTLKPHTAPETAEKNRAKKEGEKALRNFLNEFIRHSSAVTPKDRDNMRIPNKTSGPSPVPRPSSSPVAAIRPKGNRILEISFFDEGSAGRAKPYGCDGAVVCWAIMDHPPARPEELANHELATRTPHSIEFDEADRGKRVYAALRWQNGKGDMGPWSDIQTTVVP